MTHGLIIRHEAEADILAAAAWYETQGHGLGERFLDAAWTTLRNVANQPQRFSVVGKDLRRALIPRFPYAVYFYVDDEDVTVIACTRSRRDPKVWMERMWSPLPRRKQRKAPRRNTGAGPSCRG